MGSSVPKIIEEVGFDFWWDSQKVWQLDIQITVLPITELTWHFEYPFWNESGSKYNLRPIDVINFPNKHKIEYQRTLAADLKHPIDIMKNKGRWLILDGLHRLAKATINKQNVVEVRIVPRAKIPLILHERAKAMNND